MVQSDRRVDPTGNLPQVSGLATDELLEILELARWAPSGDNCQPWRVRASHSGDALEVLHEDPQHPAFLDFRLESSRIAIGAFVENLALAAGQARLDCRVDAADDLARQVWARVELARQRTAAADPLAGQIRQRVSNRRLYVPGSVSPEQLDELSRAADALAGVRVEWHTAADDLQAIGRAVALAERVRMLHRRCHEEFHDKVRWTEAAAQRDPTGFYAKTFEIKPHEAALLRLTRSYRVLRTVDALTGLSRMAGQVARRQVLASGAVGILLVDDRRPGTLLAAGRALQRMWLQATAQGLGFQVLALAPIFTRMARQAPGEFSEPQHALLRRAEEELGHLARSRDRDPALFFRLGQAAPPSARAGRIAADELLWDAAGEAG